MMIFGSYIGKERALVGEGIQITLLDTFVAIMSGVIIFPACMSYNIPTDSGPSLIFVTLPKVFEHMSGGRFWGAMFFFYDICGIIHSYCCSGEYYCMQYGSFWMEP